MKNKVIALLTAVMLLLCVGCGKSSDDIKSSLKAEPESSQMKMICELATMECYYHNVAKYLEEDASGWWIWSKDKEFWIEYSGVVSIGIDTSNLKIELDGEKVTITMPEAKVLGSKVDETTLTEESFYIAEKSASIEAEDQTAAFKEAQTNMEKKASEDTALLGAAQQRAEQLLTDYINNLGNAMGKTYTIQWNYLEKSDKDSE